MVQLKMGLITLEDVASVCDPFNCECRAYGRLKEVGREDLAIKSYGYICLSPEQEAELAERGCDDWCRLDRHQWKPIMGIVKELLDPRLPHFTPKHYDRIRKDVIDRNALGIVVWDIRAENYIDGRLVDLSQACVSPHPALDWDSTIVPRNMVQEWCTRDQLCFDEMMTDWNETCPGKLFWRFFLPSTKITAGLRPRQRTIPRVPVWELEGCRYDAAFYDWKQRGRNGSRPSRTGSGHGPINKRQ
jgi:hypothetical protein